MSSISSEAEVRVRTAFITMGFLGLVSIFVVLTPILFSRMRQLLFLRIIATISLCDTLTAIAYLLSLGRPSNVDMLSNTALCQFQGGLLNFSANASISWTIALSLQLMYVIKYSRPFLSEKIMHLIFWGIPTFLEILPYFAKMSYGMDDDLGAGSLNNCFIKVNGKMTDSKQAIFVITDIVYIFVTVVILSVVYILTKRAIDSNSKNAQLYEITRIMRLYPLAIAFCWLPVSIIGFLEDSDSVSMAFYIAALFSQMYGIFVALIYFFGSKQARYEWHALIYGPDSSESALSDFTVVSYSNLKGKDYGICDNDILVSEAPMNNSSIQLSDRESLSAQLID